MNSNSETGCHHSAIITLLLVTAGRPPREMNQDFWNKTQHFIPIIFMIYQLSLTILKRAAELSGL
jgi:hypothetical protein